MISLTFRSCGVLSQQQVVPSLLLPPIANVPEAEFIQLLWYHCDGDFSGFQGRLN